MGHEPKITFCWFIPPRPRWLLIYLNLSPWVKHSHQNFHFSDWILGESKSRSQNSLLLAVGEDGTFKPLPALMEGGAKECSESWGPRSQARLSHKTHRVQEMPACAVLLGAPIQGSSAVMVQEDTKHIRLEVKNAQSDIIVILDQEREDWRMDPFLLKSPLLDYLTSLFIV